MSNLVRVLVLGLMLVLVVAILRESGSSPRLRQRFSQFEDSFAPWTGKEPVWTPERIAADSAGYARYAQERIRTLSEEFDANVRRVRSQVAELGAMAHENDAALKSAQSELTGMCKAYVRARDAGSWPVQLGGVTFDEDALKRAIAMAQWQVEQRENLKQRIRQEYERKQMEAGRLELNISNIRLDQIALAGTAEELRVQDTIQNIQQLEDLVHAAADTGTESFVHELMEAREVVLSDEQLDQLLKATVQEPPATPATSIPDSVPPSPASGLDEMDPLESAPPAAATTFPKRTQAVASSPVDPSPAQTLTPMQKDALGIDYACPVPTVKLRKTPVYDQPGLIRSDRKVPLLPSPSSRRFR